MKKSIAFGIIFLLISICVIPSTGTIVEKQNIKQISNNGNILYVGGNGTGNYTKIQDAIDDASNGDTVFVFNNSSPYYENVIVDKSINLIGEDKNTTVIEGQNVLVWTLYIIDNYVTVTGFTIQYYNDEDGVGICLRCGNNNIHGNNIRHVDYGIAIHGSSNNQIYNNNITNNWRGIFIQCAQDFARSNNIYQNNIIENNIGIYFSPGCWPPYWVSDNNVYQNNIMYNRLGIKIVGSTPEVSNNAIFHNNFIKNQKNARDSGSNTWDNVTQGNYWDNYIGLKYPEWFDRNNDGIGDIPYLVRPYSKGNKDRYPLMEPLGKIPNVNYINYNNYHSQQQTSQQTSFMPRSQSVMNIVTTSGNTILNDDTTPPFTICTLNPSEPDGKAGWYVSDVTVILNATDDMSGVNVTYYKVDGEEWEIYTEPFVLSKDGIHSVEYYSVDNVGNVEDVKTVELKIDQTKPKIYFRYDAYNEEDQWYYLFTANCSDATSGMNRVEFYVNGELKKTVVGPGPLYEWIEELNCRYDVTGWICNRKITEEKVSFFALVVWREWNYSLLPSIDDIGAQAYDNAGNWDVNIIIDGWRPPSPGILWFYRFTFQNDYEGYIGRFYIDATFKVDL